MGEKKLGKPPLPESEHRIHMLSLETGWKPDEIRQMSHDDVAWQITYRSAQRLALTELRRRSGNK